VHYKGYKAKFDEWIPRVDRDARFRPYGRQKLLPQKIGSIAQKVRTTGTVTGPATGISSGGALRTGKKKQWRVPSMVPGKPSSITGEANTARLGSGTASNEGPSRYHLSAHDSDAVAGERTRNALLNGHQHLLSGTATPMDHPSGSVANRARIRSRTDDGAFNGAYFDDDIRNQDGSSGSGMQGAQYNYQQHQQRLAELEWQQQNRLPHLAGSYNDTYHAHPNGSMLPYVNGENIHPNVVSESKESGGYGLNSFDGSSMNQPVEVDGGGNEGDDRTRRITTLSSQYQQYVVALAQRQLSVVPVEGDGNCLFRAAAHQIYGDEGLHYVVRQKCCDYMEAEAEFFSQFVVGGRVMFPLYLQAKRTNACWGDDPEIEVSGE
jgi:hypothetical protein